MPVPSAITDLSTTAASNSPAGSENVFPDLDNHLRAAYSFIAQNYANKATVASPAFTGQAMFPDGTTAAPSITNTGDLDTGLLFPAADTVSVVSGGVEAVRVNSSQKVRVGSSAEPFSASFQINAVNNGALILAGSNSVTDATNKAARFGVWHYSNSSEEEVSVIGASTTLGANSVEIGGGASALNAATSINFYTAATTSTLTGTVCTTLDSSGNLIQRVNTSAPTLSTNGTMTFSLTSNTNLRISVRGSDGTTRVANLTLA